MAVLSVAVSSASTPFNSAVQLSSSSFTHAPHISKTVKRGKNCKGRRIFCSTGREKSGDSNTSSSNVVLKIAWYASEALGVAASLFKPTSNPSEQHSQSQLLQDEVTGSIPRDAVVDAIRNDYQTSYFVTGNLTISIYKEDCEFADPAGSFKGLRRFKRNCSNFGSLVKTSNMKLMDWKDFEVNAYHIYIFFVFFHSLDRA
ncbi:uncharacterized protein LOC131060568 [Cryptomeria japonica]|uniref:uncharacterized protein LOC131060568 n=1 Tax=Cryptomeria japonica TaxID=3369 RepID=UPI0027D9F4B2|nr:uncharacterized protein LOC131060568 [Cryptomeria japonica]